MKIFVKTATRFLYVVTLARLSSSPQPIDAPQAHGSGPDPDRVLLIGTGPIVGRGMLSHQMALPGRLARGLAQITGRGADVDVVVNKRRGTAAAIKALRELDLSKHDAIVVTLSASQAFALTAEKRWSKEIVALLKALLDASSPDTAIILAGIHPSISESGINSRIRGVVEEHARALNRISQRVCNISSRTRFVRLPYSARWLEPNRSATYLEWARVIVGSLATSLPSAGPRVEAGSPTARELRGQIQPLAGRQRALADLGISRTGSEMRFDRVVVLARAYFDTQFAAFTLSDGHSDTFKSKSGFRGSPHISELASATIDAGGPLLVGNARADTRFTPSPVVRESGIGFYAGYPVEAPDGNRIGVLCVFDQNPRVTRAADTVMLQDLAMMIQRELWTRSERVLKIA